MKTDNQDLMSEINITPFVDVMLVLLIIFMVTAPMLQQGVEVALPKTTAAKSLTPDKNHLVLSINKNKKIFINDTHITTALLKTKLKYILKNSKNKEIYLRADKDVNYGFVVKIMAIVKASGVQKLGMVTELDEEISNKK